MRPITGSSRAKGVDRDGRRNDCEQPTSYWLTRLVTVLQICVSTGVQACAKGVPILAEGLERNSTKLKTESQSMQIVYGYKVQDAPSPSVVVEKSPMHPQK
jgi:hypothetical protein